MLPLLLVNLGEPDAGFKVSRSCNFTKNIAVLYKFRCRS
jgi:hypothetical protein